MGLMKIWQNIGLFHLLTHQSKWDAAKDVWRVYRQLEKLSFFYSIWCFLNYAFNAVIKRI